MAATAFQEPLEGQGLWPVPVLCPKELVSSLSPGVNINPGQERSFLGQSLQSSFCLQQHKDLGPPKETTEKTVTLQNKSASLGGCYSQCEAARQQLAPTRGIGVSGKQRLWNPNPESYPWRRLPSLPPFTPKTSTILAGPRFSLRSGLKVNPSAPSVAP